LPYPDPDRLVRLFEETPTTPHFPMAPSDFRDYRGQLEAFDGIAAFFRADLQIGDASRPEQLTGMQASAGFFTLLGRPPAWPRLHGGRRRSRGWRRRDLEPCAVDALADADRRPSSKERPSVGKT
jgi:hypothetical protein